MDHEQFDGPLLEKATAAILKTRDGKLRAAVPVSPMGECVFLNDVSHEEMCRALETHKQIMKQYPRNGEGLDAYVDSSDTGYTMHGTNGKLNDIESQMKNGDSVPRSHVMNGNDRINGHAGTKAVPSLPNNVIPSDVRDSIHDREAGRVNVVTVDGPGRGSP